jgi:hypothetical protein
MTWIAPYIKEIMLLLNLCEHPLYRVLQKGMKSVRKAEKIFFTL